MLLILGGLLGIAAGLAAGGRLARLAELRLRVPGVVFAAFAIKEAGVFYDPLAFSPIAPWLYTLALAALCAWTFWHRDRLPGIEVVAAGMAMNLLAVAANLGHMPVARELASRGRPELLTRGTVGQYVLAGPHTRLEWLGDWIALPGSLGKALPGAYSPGDLVAVLGMAIALYLAVRPARGSDPAS